MRDPIIDCMAKEFIREFMFRGDSICAGCVIESLPLEHFELSCDEKDELEYYIGDLIDTLASEYDYDVSDENDTCYVPAESKKDTCNCDECDECDGCYGASEDETNEENSDTVVYKTSNAAGQLTIPAKFIRAISEPGGSLVYACYGNEVLIFPEKNTKLLKMVKKEEKEGTTTNVIYYNPHWTHGYYEVRRTMNDLFDNLEDAGNEQFQIELDADEGMIHVFRA